MKILVVGSGGREHALIWKMKQSPSVESILCAPGNGGIQVVTDCIPVAADDIDGQLRLAKEHKIDLTIVGPEVPLADGIVDAFQIENLKIFGPTKNAARIEGSKAFAKDLMRNYSIPTAEYESFSDSDKAFDYLSTHQAPIVVKADGLAAGKGAIVCQTDDEAHNAIQSIMVERAFGDSGNTVIIEEYLTGEELSVFVLTDGTNYVILPSAQDHKPVYDGDTGPNTGGMGAYAPAPIADDVLMMRICKEIIRPTIDALKQEDSLYTGLLYAGLMITDTGPKVIEFNCRFGDPETQAVLPLIENDVVDLMEATCDGTLDQHSLRLLSLYSVCVVMASGGYPGSYEMGKEIKGLNSIVRAKDKNVFHAGTKLKDGKFYTNGGRVICVNALNQDLSWAIDNTYLLADSIHFEKAYFRTDIGKKGLSRLQKS